MRAGGFHTITLGCKLNQFDSAAIEGELARRGFTPRDDPAAARVVIINTCTVTHRADSDARKLIRSVRRKNPDCTLLVTGCYAEADPEALRALQVDRVFGNRDKARFGSILDELGLLGLTETDRGCDAGAALPAALHFGHRSRAFLKIQEGCRLRCSYCIIPEVRGPSRSVPAEEVLDAAIRLHRDGYREIVLTGVNTGDYGRDLEPRTDLETLLRALLAAVPTGRLRLNSLEPRTVTDGIIELMAGDPRLAPHLQVPMQAGSDTTLRAMRRNYDLAFYAQTLSRLSVRVPGIGLGADVIVGFPGETDDAFRETQAFIEASPLSYLHVFSWSARRGTPAAELPDRVDEAVIRRRSTDLRSLAERRSLTFRRQFEGVALDAVVLGPRKDDGRLRALTGNFIEVSLPPGSAAPGELIEVRIERVTSERTDARATGFPAWSSAGTAEISG